jgi:hypothetical protein
MNRRKFLNSIAGLGLAGAGLDVLAQRTPDVIFVPTDYQDCRGMLKLAAVTSKDIVYDLCAATGASSSPQRGSFARARRRHRHRPERIKEARELSKRTGADDKVRFIEGDWFCSRHHEATW